MDDLIGKNKMFSTSSFPKLGDKSESSYFVTIPNEIDSTKDSISKIKINEISSDPHQEESKKYIHKEHNDNEYQLEDTSDNPYSKSNYTDDIIINSHPRFGTLTRNIRTRRGSKVNIKIPIYKDILTNLNHSSEDEPFPGYIHMDAMAFGMGSCSLQVTLGTCSLNSTCFLYDQLIPLTPILLALSSSGPIYKGKLSGYDNRFDVISQSVDDRTEEERDVNSKRYICKSRYSPVYSYISEHVYVQDFHNDYPKFPINEAYLKTMLDSGISKRLSEHFCNLLVRDPLVIFEDKIKITDKSDRSHFENFNSTNWNSLRFKPPRVEDNDTCFKVEVRPCDLQLTPFENSAIISLIISLYASLFNFDANFIMPISKVDENFERAYQCDAINKQKFYWRVNGIDTSFKNINAEIIGREFLAHSDNLPDYLKNKEEDMKNIKELSIKEIFLGSEEYDYPGIIKLCMKGINVKIQDEHTRNYLKRFLNFVEKRATGIKLIYYLGELCTDAKYIRNFVLEHPKYKKDSIVSDEINYDLITHLLDIQSGKVIPEKLFGNFLNL